MGILDRFKRKEVTGITEKQPEASVQTGICNYYSLSFDGENTPYELGNPINFELDYYAIRLRAWESFIKSDLLQNAIKKYCLWVIGSGLKLQSDPLADVLRANGISITDAQASALSEMIESKFRLFANSSHSSYSGNVNETLHDLAAEGLKNAILSGDVLVLERYDGENTTTQIIDGGFIRDPFGTDYFDQAARRGNTITKGVEVDSKGTHVAYYVYTGALKYDRILARGEKTGRLQAWLMYGMKNKINDVRGMSLLTAVLETIAKIDRYKDAAVSAAQENQNIPFTFEHGSSSDGEDPMARELANTMSGGKGTAPETSFDQCKGLADKVAISTTKKVYNLPIGAKLVRNNFQTDINFEQFYKVNANIIYATIGISPEVATELYGGAYSGSRAALKGLEHKMNVDRTVILKRQFYHPIYSYWLDINVIQGKITAPGYLNALQTKNLEVLESYRNNRFIGAGVPHIDPKKEADAERVKLGKGLINMPLTTIEQSMENLATGDYNGMIKKVTNEKEYGKDLLIIDAPVTE